MVCWGFVFRALWRRKVGVWRSLGEFRKGWRHVMSCRHCLYQSASYAWSWGTSDLETTNELTHHFHGSWVNTFSFSEPQHVTNTPHSHSTLPLSHILLHPLTNLHTHTHAHAHSLIYSLTTRSHHVGLCTRSGTERQSPVTFQTELHYPHWKRWLLHYPIRSVVALSFNLQDEASAFCTDLLRNGSTYSHLVLLVCTVCW